MNYSLHYSRLIERAKGRELAGYSERHHIVPRCVDKSSKETVRLTPEEHYVAHQLLVKMFPDNHKLVYAAVSMTMRSDTTLPRRNKLYGWLRRELAAAASERQKGQPWPGARHIAENGSWNKGKTGGTLSEDHKTELSAAQLRSYADNPERASRHSETMKAHYDKPGVREAMSLAMTERYADPENRKPHSEATKELCRQKALQRFEENPEARVNAGTFSSGMTPWNVGVPHSDETRKRMRKPKSEQGRINIGIAARARAAAKRLQIENEVSIG